MRNDNDEDDDLDDRPEDFDDEAAVALDTPVPPAPAPAPAPAAVADLGDAPPPTVPTVAAVEMSEADKEAEAARAAAIASERRQREALGADIVADLRRRIPAMVQGRILPPTDPALVSSARFFLYLLRSAAAGTVQTAELSVLLSSWPRAKVAELASALQTLRGFVNQLDKVGGGGTRPLAQNEAFLEAFRSVALS